MRVGLHRLVVTLVLRGVSNSNDVAAQPGSEGDLFSVCSTKIKVGEDKTTLIARACKGLPLTSESSSELRLTNSSLSFHIQSNPLETSTGSTPVVG